MRRLNPSYLQPKNRVNVKIRCREVPCSGLAFSGIVLCIEYVGPLSVIKYGFCGFIVCILRNEFFCQKAFLKGNHYVLMNCTHMLSLLYLQINTVFCFDKYLIIFMILTYRGYMRNRNAMGTKFCVTDVDQEPASLSKIQGQDLAVLVEHRKMNLCECSGFGTNFCDSIWKHWSLL